MSEQLQALGTYSDGSSQDITQKAEWKCSPGKIAGAEGGEVRGLAVGEAEVTAALNGVTSGKAKITVTDAEPIGYIISASGVNVSGKLQLNAGETQQLRVRALLSDGSGADVTGSVIWGSDNIKDAAVSEQGVITAKQPGTANITVKDAAGKIIGELRVTVAAAEVTAVSISKTKLTVAAGYTEIISAAASYSDGSTVDVSGSAAWRSSDPSIADAEVKKASGRTRVTVIARKPGQTVISASFAGKTASCAVKVTDAELVSMVIEPASLTIAHGLTANLTVKGGFSDGTGRDITDDCRFFTGNENIAIAESAGRNTTAGLVHGVGKGTAVITAKKGGSKAEARVTVSDAAVTSLSLSSESDSVIAGYTLEMTAAAAYSDGSRSSVNNAAEWTSGSPKTAAVDDKGTVRGLTAGETTVTAAIDDQKISFSLSVIEYSETVLTREILTEQLGYAFSGSSLTKDGAPVTDLDIPETYIYDGRRYKVTAIGEAVFSGCKNITSVTIPASVTSIGAQAFFDCDGLKSAIIPESVTTIGGDAFGGPNVLLDSATVPCDLLGSSGSPRAHDITITPGTSKTIGAEALYESDWLTSATIGGDIKSIGASAFERTGLTEISIPGSVQSIGDKAFNECALKSITLSDGVKTIGNYAFSRNYAAELEIPGSVQSIGNYAFYDSSALTSVTIPKGITSIKDSAFRGCGALTSIDIPDSVESIGDYAFSESGLTELTIPGSVDSVGVSAFSACYSLTELTISDGVATIGDEAFYYCDGVDSVTIPDSVTSIGSDAFCAVPHIEYHGTAVDDGSHWGAQSIN